MLPSSEAFAAAIVAPHRQILPKGLINIIDPDAVFSEPTTSGALWFCVNWQLYNKEFESNIKYASLEHNYWLLDGSFEIAPEGKTTVEAGMALDSVCGEDRMFPEPQPWVQVNVRSMELLQTATIFFMGRPDDGVAEEFIFEVFSGGALAYSTVITGNTAQKVTIEDFTAYSAEQVRITFIKWSLPYMRPRTVEFLLGVYERLDGNNIINLDVVHETAFDCLTTPFGVCTLTIENKDKRYNPHSKSSVFLSIEERQGIPIELGAALPDGTVEYMPVGVFYQQDGGWETSAYGLEMTFKLVDIVGLLVQRTWNIDEYANENLLSEWVRMLLSHLGENFAEHYIVDEDADVSVRLHRGIDAWNNKAYGDLAGVDLGAILRYLCMRTGTFFRMDPETGYLRISKVPTDGGTRIPLDEQYTFPVEGANKEIADINFKDSAGNDYGPYAGTLTTSGISLSVQNAFAASADLDTLARNILEYFGGNRTQISGRGDPRCELGDIDIIATAFGDEITGRRFRQQFKFSNGIMAKTPASFVTADGASKYENRVELTGEGTWEAPANASLTVYILGGGETGEKGTGGVWDYAGMYGNPGWGGKVLVVTIRTSESQSFSYRVGESDEDTLFGAYTSADGLRYTGGWRDLFSGKVYGQRGTSRGGYFGTWNMPIPGDDGPPNTGNGGGGGYPGMQGVRYRDGETGEWVVVGYQYPGLGGPGGKGGSGSIVIYYEKPEEDVT